MKAKLKDLDMLTITTLKKNESLESFMVRTAYEINEVLFNPVRRHNLMQVQVLGKTKKIGKYWR